MRLILSSPGHVHFTKTGVPVNTSEIQRRISTTVVYFFLLFHMSKKRVVKDASLVSI